MKTRSRNLFCSGTLTNFIVGGKANIRTNKEHVQSRQEYIFLEHCNHSVFVIQWLWITIEDSGILPILVNGSKISISLINTSTSKFPHIFVYKLWVYLQPKIFSLSIKICSKTWPLNIFHQEPKSYCN
jgi:hypothetical protein